MELPVQVQVTTEEVHAHPRHTGHRLLDLVRLARGPIGAWPPPGRHLRLPSSRSITGSMPRKPFEDVPDQRRRIMSRIRPANTKPEMAVRRCAHAMGYRFRLHRRDLPGRPDLVFPARWKIVFVHGCFWHAHPDPSCRISSKPKTRTEYWHPKLSENAARDQRNIEKLVTLGWAVLVIWECELRDMAAVASRLQAFLGPPHVRAPRTRPPCPEASSVVARERAD